MGSNFKGGVHLGGHYANRKTRQTVLTHDVPGGIPVSNALFPSTKPVAQKRIT